MKMNVRYVLAWPSVRTENITSRFPMEVRDNILCCTKQGCCIRWIGSEDDQIRDGLFGDNDHMMIIGWFRMVKCNIFRRLSNAFEWEKKTPVGKTMSDKNSSRLEGSWR